MARAVVAGVSKLVTDVTVPHQHRLIAHFARPGDEALHPKDRARLQRVSHRCALGQLVQCDERGWGEAEPAGQGVGGREPLRTDDLVLVDEHRFAGPTGKEEPREEAFRLLRRR